MELFAPIRKEVLCDVSIKVVHSVLGLQSSTDIRAIHCDTKSWFWHSNILDMNQLLLSDIVHLKLPLPSNTDLSEVVERKHPSQTVVYMELLRQIKVSWGMTLHQLLISCQKRRSENELFQYLC
jgi:hypothetical protein